MTGLLVFMVSSPSMADGYAHKISAEKVTFEWTVNGPAIDIRISAPTTGWVGIGFNPTEKMKDANYIIGYVAKGKATISDDYGKSERSHEEDTKAGGTKDVTAVSGSESNGTTTLAFTVPLNSGDSKDQVLDINGDTTVLLAYGSGRDSVKARHMKHYMFRVNLSTGAFKDIHNH